MDYTTVSNEMDKSPTMKKIINRLKDHYPSIIIGQEGIFKQDGSFLSLDEIGEQGIAYRNGLKAAVAWSMGSPLDTPPHEYAHVYIDMFRANPLIQEGISKYGEEQLADYMGKTYVDQVKPSIRSFVNRIWLAIKGVFGIQTVRDEIFKSFFDGISLGPESFSSEDFVAYKSGGQQKLRRMDGVIDFNDDIYSNSVQASELRNLDESTISTYINEIEGAADLNDAWNSDINPDVLNSEIKRFLSKLVSESQDLNLQEGTNTETVADKIDRMFLSKVDFNAVPLFEKMMGHKVDLDPQMEELYGVLKNMVVDKIHKQ